MTRFVSLMVACFVVAAMAAPVLNQAAQIVA
jgi:hypothetical protein